VIGGLLATAFIAMPLFAQEQSASKDDMILTAMRVELDRAKSQLKMDPVAPPYYIEYRVFDMENFGAEAAFGKLRGEVRTRFRFLRVAVRIGDYKQDSYIGRGEGTVDFLPVDDDMLAFRHQLWLATDRAYKAAAESLTGKQAQLKQLTIDQPVDDFAHATPVQSIGPVVTLDINPDPWKKMLQDASAVYKDDPLIENFETRLNFVAVNRYLVTSEGTAVRSGQNLYEMVIACSTQAADGMSLSRDNSFSGTSLKELPTTAEFVGRASKLAGTLKELRDAPVVEEDYRGPVLLSGEASADMFAELVGENVLGRKPEIGKNARTIGQFASSYKTRVLPDFLSVVDDPMITSYRGHALLGHYEIDDEGTPAQRVAVIEKGNLVNYVIGRQPIRDFPMSNGHGRAGIPNNPAGASLGNLIVTSDQPLSADALKAKFLDLCKQRDLAYCYYVETFGGRLTPRLLYRVYVKDARQELVRGSVLGDLDIRALRSDLVAAGDDAHVEGRMLNIPHSIVAPSTLFDELEVKRANQNKEKLPEYPPPPIVK
jgi:predicted Zn-dependent protease